MECYNTTPCVLTRTDRTTGITLSVPKCCYLCHCNNGTCTSICNTNSVVLSCMCEIALCQSCAKKLFADQETTFCKGLRCPLCLEVSRNVLMPKYSIVPISSVDEVNAEIDKLIDSICVKLGVDHMSKQNRILTELLRMCQASDTYTVVAATNQWSTEKFFELPPDRQRLVMARIEAARINCGDPLDKLRFLKHAPLLHAIEAAKGVLDITVETCLYCMGDDYEFDENNPPIQFICPQGCRCCICPSCVSELLRRKNNVDARSCGSNNYEQVLCLTCFSIVTCFQNSDAVQELEDSIIAEGLKKFGLLLKKETRSFNNVQLAGLYDKLYELGVTRILKENAPEYGKFSLGCVATLELSAITAYYINNEDYILKGRGPSRLRRATKAAIEAHTDPIFPMEYPTLKALKPIGDIYALRLWQFNRAIMEFCPIEVPAETQYTSFRDIICDGTESVYDYDSGNRQLKRWFRLVDCKIFPHESKDGEIDNFVERALRFPDGCGGRVVGRLTSPLSGVAGMGVQDKMVEVAFKDWSVLYDPPPEKLLGLAPHQRGIYVIPVDARAQNCCVVLSPSDEMNEMTEAVYAIQKCYERLCRVAVKRSSKENAFYHFSGFIALNNQNSLTKPWLGVLKERDILECKVREDELLRIISKLFVCSDAFSPKCAFFCSCKQNLESSQTTVIEDQVQSVEAAVQMDVACDDLVCSDNVLFAVAQVAPSSNQPHSKNEDIKLLTPAEHHALMKSHQDTLDCDRHDAGVYAMKPVRAWRSVIYMLFGTHYIRSDPEDIMRRCSINLSQMELILKHCNLSCDMKHQFTKEEFKRTIKYISTIPSRIENTYISDGKDYISESAELHNAAKDSFELVSLSATDLRTPYEPSSDGGLSSDLTPTSFQFGSSETKVEAVSPELVHDLLISFRPESTKTVELKHFTNTELPESTISNSFEGKPSQSTEMIISSAEVSTALKRRLPIDPRLRMLSDSAHSLPQFSTGYLPPLLPQLPHLIPIVTDSTKFPEDYDEEYMGFIDDIVNQFSALESIDSHLGLISYIEQKNPKSLLQFRGSVEVPRGCLARSNPIYCVLKSYLKYEIQRVYEMLIPSIGLTHPSLNAHKPSLDSTRDDAINRLMKNINNVLFREMSKSFVKFTELTFIANIIPELVEQEVVMALMKLCLCHLYYYDVEDDFYYVRLPMPGFPVLKIEDPLTCSYLNKKIRDFNSRAGSGAQVAASERGYDFQRLFPSSLGADRSSVFSGLSESATKAMAYIKNGAVTLKMEVVVAAKMKLNNNQGRIHHSSYASIAPQKLADINKLINQREGEVDNIREEINVLKPIVDQSIHPIGFGYDYEIDGETELVLLAERLTFLMDEVAIADTELRALKNAAQQQNHIIKLLKVKVSSGVYNRRSVVGAPRSSFYGTAKPAVNQYDNSKVISRTAPATLIGMGSATATSVLPHAGPQLSTSEPSRIIKQTFSSIVPASVLTNTSSKQSSFDPTTSYEPAPFTAGEPKFLSSEPAIPPMRIEKLELPWRIDRLGMNSFTCPPNDDANRFDDVGMSRLSPAPLKEACAYGKRRRSRSNSRDRAPYSIHNNHNQHSEYSAQGRGNKFGNIGRSSSDYGKSRRSRSRSRSQPNRNRPRSRLYESNEVNREHSFGVHDREVQQRESFQVDGLTAGICSAVVKRRSRSRSRSLHRQRFSYGSRSRSKSPKSFRFSGGCNGKSKCTNDIAAATVQQTSYSALKGTYTDLPDAVLQRPRLTTERKRPKNPPRYVPKDRQAEYKAIRKFQASIKQETLQQKYYATEIEEITKNYFGAS